MNKKDNPLLNMKVDASSAITKKVSDKIMTEDEKRKMRRAALFKILVMFLFVAVVMVFSSIAWFTMNKENAASGMGVRVQELPYTIQTRSGSGTYSSTYQSLGTDGAEWKISSDYNFDNHESAKKVGETEPGLEPGDHGILEFRVNPNSGDAITVDCVFDIKAYVETITLDQNNSPVTQITEINDAALVGYLKAHIMLFTGIDPNTGKYTGLIGNDESLRRVLANQTYAKDSDTYTKIYWVWPMYLNNLISSDDSQIIYTPSQRSAVIAYMANNKDGFFKDCNDSISQVSTDLTALSTANNNTVFNRYNMKYDNADLDIGNNISYVLLSMHVE